MRMSAPHLLPTMLPDNAEVGRQGVARRRERVVVTRFAGMSVRGGAAMTRAPGGSMFASRWPATEAVWVSWRGGVCVRSSPRRDYQRMGTGFTSGLTRAAWWLRPV